MNVLWIEDFGGGLSASRATFANVFGELSGMGAAVRPEADEFWESLRSRSRELEQFLVDHAVPHRICLCLNYADFSQRVPSPSIDQDFDVVLIDINLDNLQGMEERFDVVPEGFEAGEFHRKAGFYIHNHLVRAGFPAGRMCFLTGELPTLNTFEQDCRKAFLPKPRSFEKSDAGFSRLREWLKGMEQDAYLRLRRGVIEACRSLRGQLNEDFLRIRDFCKGDHEITLLDVGDQLDLLENLLPASPPENLDHAYRVWLRALVHEWDGKLHPDHLPPHGAIHDLVAYAYILKRVRNWVAHGNLLCPLTAQLLAYLFLLNARAIFRLPVEVENWEKPLLEMFPDVELPELSVISHSIKNAIALAKEDAAAYRIDEKYYDQIQNELYERSCGNPDAEPRDFQQVLFRLFWIEQSKQLRQLLNEDRFNRHLARRIYPLSFPD